MGLTVLTGLSRYTLLAVENRSREFRATKAAMASQSQQGDGCVSFEVTDEFAHELSDLDNQPGRFTPWQIIASTLTAVYAVRNFDKILGLPGEWNHSFPIHQMLISILKPRSL